MAKKYEEPVISKIEESQGKAPVEAVIIPSEPVITLTEYCSTLPTRGIDKFAKVRIEEKLREWKIDMPLATRTEWEKVYCKVKIGEI